MDEFVKIITHARRFKSAVKNIDIEQLEDVRRKLDTIIESRKQELVEKEKENEEKLKKIEKYKMLLAADGLLIDDLKDSSKKIAGKKGVNPPKYRIKVNDKYVTWSGHGRMPNVFKEKLDEGKDLDSYLIS